MKVKKRMTLSVVVHDGDPKLVRWGDWGWAVRLTLTYPHPLTGAPTTVEELARVREPDIFQLKRGPASVLCWGVLPSGRLRHPGFLGWGQIAA